MHEGHRRTYLRCEKYVRERAHSLYMLGVKEDSKEQIEVLPGIKIYDRKTSLRVCHCHRLVGSGDLRSQ